MSDVIIECANLTKIYKDSEKEIQVFDNLELQVRRAEMIAITGRSGAGKTSFLQLLGALDKPTAGHVLIGGTNISDLADRELSKWRNIHMGFIFQFHHLLPEFSALENVAMPQLIHKKNISVAKDAAAHMLEKVGLKERLSHKPGTLSGGERQRVAIARALINNPICVLADEPTGNLDDKTADEVFNLLLTLNQDLKTTFLIVTHDRETALKTHKEYSLEDKKLVLVK